MSAKEKAAPGQRGGETRAADKHDGRRQFTVCGTCGQNMPIGEQLALFPLPDGPIVPRGEKLVGTEIADLHGWPLGNANDYRRLRLTLDYCDGAGLTCKNIAGAA